jgi:hypothetical protein
MKMKMNTGEDDLFKTSNATQRKLNRASRKAGRQANKAKRQAVRAGKGRQAVINEGTAGNPRFLSGAVTRDTSGNVPKKPEVQPEKKGKILSGTSSRPTGFGRKKGKRVPKSCKNMSWTNNCP